MAVIYPKLWNISTLQKRLVIHTHSAYSDVIKRLRRATGHLHTGWLHLNTKADCATATGALDAHLGHVRTRLAELKALEKDLRALRGRCGGLDTTCHIIEALHQRADRLPNAVRAATKSAMFSSFVVLR